MAKWHVIVSSELTEEMSLEEVKRAFHARRIGEDTLVWQKGMDRWLPLSQALSLRRDSSMPPAPPPSSFHVPPIAVEVVEVVEATGPDEVPQSRAAGSWSRGADSWSVRFHPRRFLGRGTGALAWTGYAWLTWYVAALLGATAGLGFFAYALGLYALSALACCFCPCLGFAGVWATTAIWGMIWLYSVCIFAAAWLLAMALSFFAALMLLVDNEAPRPLVIGNLVVHLALGACLFGAGAFAMLASATGIGR